MSQEVRHILGVDLGAKRIGLAIADSTLKIATGLDVLEYKGLKSFLEKLKKIIEDEEINLVVVGLPLNMNGSEGAKAREARKIAGQITKELGVIVKLVDEGLSTSQATERLHDAGGKVGKSRAKLNIMAAMIILQDYLDGLTLEKNDEA